MNTELTVEQTARANGNIEATIVKVHDWDTFHEVILSNGATIYIWNGEPCYEAYDDRVGANLEPGSIVVGWNEQEDGTLLWIFDYPEDPEDEAERIQSSNQDFIKKFPAPHKISGDEWDRRTATAAFQPEAIEDTAYAAKALSKQPKPKAKPLSFEYLLIGFILSSFGVCFSGIIILALDESISTWGWTSLIAAGVTNTLFFSILGVQRHKAKRLLRRKVARQREEFLTLFREGWKNSPDLRQRRALHQANADLMKAEAELKNF